MHMMPRLPSLTLFEREPVGQILLGLRPSPCRLSTPSSSFHSSPERLLGAAQRARPNIPLGSPQRLGSQDIFAILATVSQVQRTDGRIHSATKP